MAQTRESPGGSLTEVCRREIIEFLGPVGFASYRLASSGLAGDGLDRGNHLVGVNSNVNVIELSALRNSLDLGEVIEVMREALVAQARGECQAPMPMHIDTAPSPGEVHIKAASRRGGSFYAVKVASLFPDNATRGLSTGNGLMMLFSAETGHPEAILLDEGYLTDVRTAAVSALMARELGRRDQVIGVLGSGIQARLQVDLHREVLDLEQIWIWGRTREKVEVCAQEIRQRYPDLEVHIAESPGQVAEQARLIVTVTAAHDPLLLVDSIRPGTLISAVGSDSPGKQELDPVILDRAELVIVDSRPQCERLGELQHALGNVERSIEAGDFCESPIRPSSEGVVVCDFTGLGVEDLFIASSVYAKIETSSGNRKDS